MSKEKKKTEPIPLPLDYRLPTLEFTGNREVIIEGCRGVLGYTPEEIRIHTAAMTISVLGRGLNLRCISDSALIAEGFITSVEFHT